MAVMSRVQALSKAVQLHRIFIYWYTFASALSKLASNLRRYRKPFRGLYGCRNHVGHAHAGTDCLYSAQASRMPGQVIMSSVQLGRLRRGQKEGLLDPKCCWGQRCRLWKQSQQHYLRLSGTSRW